MTMNTSVAASIATRHICQGFSIGSAVLFNFLYQIETLNLFVDEIYYRRNCSSYPGTKDLDLSSPC
jgi:hypothetical protein